MSVYTKRIIFALVSLVVLGAVGVWAPEVQRFLGMFALGWMLMDIAGSVFPEGN
jgi:hypothetical protein